MNALSFIHVNCWLVQNSNQQIDHENLQQQMTDHLWPNTKIRMQRWKASVGFLEPKLDTTLVNRSQALDPTWLAFYSLVDEIILSESLTRILFAVVASKTDCGDVRDIVQDVLKDNFDMRERVIRIAASSPIVLQDRADKFAELKILNEHITDMLLSQLPERKIARTFAIKHDAFDEFAKCAGPYQKAVIRQANIALGLAFSNGIQNLAHPITVNEDINQRIVNDIADLFPPSTLKHFPGRSPAGEILTAS